MLCLLSSHAYIRNILQSHFIHLRVQIYFFRGVVHGASGLTYKIKQEPQAHTLEPHTTTWLRQPTRSTPYSQTRT